MHRRQKVNHKLVPISYKLKSGDQIEIITSAKQKPNSEWLNFVVTSKARSKIKDSLKEEKRHIAEDGKYILQRKLESMNAVYNQTNVEEIANFYKINSSLDLLYEIAIKKIDLKELKGIYRSWRQGHSAEDHQTRRRKKQKRATTGLCQKKMRN